MTEKEEIDSNQRNESLELMIVGNGENHFDSPDHIIDNIFLGSEDSAHLFTELQNLHITHILVVGSDLTVHFPKEFQYMHIGIDDIYTANIKQHFPKAIEFIQSSQASVDDSRESSGNILIHCAAGVSRSASIVIAYLIKVHNLSYHEALEYARRKRRVVNPNSGFCKQLRTYATELREERSKK